MSKSIRAIRSTKIEGSEPKNVELHDNVTLDDIRERRIRNAWKRRSIRQRRSRR